MKIWWIKSPNRKLSIPDWLSIYRILSAPLLITLLVLEERIVFGVFLVISFITDCLDGFLARRMKIISERGAQLDSIGDAITFIVALSGVVKFEFFFVQKHITLITIAFGLYILQLLMAYWRYGMPSSFHTYLAKLAAISQGTFLCWIFFLDIEYWLFYLALILSMLETIEEIILIILLPKWKSNVKGLFWVLKKYNKISS